MTLAVACGIIEINFLRCREFVAGDTSEYEGPAHWRRGGDDPAQTHFEATP